MTRVLALTGVLAAALAGAAVPAAASAAPTTPAAPSPLGPDCYRNLCLGQTAQQAIATGLVDPGEQSTTQCVRYNLRNSEGQTVPGRTVSIDPKLGVVMIDGTDEMRTPQGIGYDNTLAEVQAAYPDLHHIPPQDFVYQATAPGSANLYTFAFTDNKVNDFLLQSPNQGSC